VIIGMILVVGLLAGAYILVQRQIEEKVAQKFYLARNYAEEGKWKKAFPVFEEIFKKYPKDRKAVESMFFYALSLEKLDRVDEAWSVYSKISEDYPESNWAAPSLINLAGIKKGKGELKEAQRLYERVTNEFKESDSLGDACIGLGEIYEEEGKLAEARSFYERVISELPQSDLYYDAQKHLGNLLIKMIFSSYPIMSSFVYKVSSGDTLDDIARRFNTTVDLIKEANQLESPRLSIGRRLKITPGHFNILVSKSKNILILKYKDELVKIYTVATGKLGCTPVGDFKITNKIKDPDWYRHGRKIPSGHPDNILGTRWMGISEESYGIHGTTQPETIGKQSTEGCVRMANEDVEELYKLVTVGIPVKIIE